MIYLDNSATTQVDKDIAQVSYEMMTEYYGNPSSPYMFAREALLRMTSARNQVAKVISAPTDRIFFTSGGTEANNIALQGVMAHFNFKGKLITTQIEHSSIIDSSKKMERLGCEVVYVAPQDGRIQAKHIIEQVGEDTRLVSVMAVNNETGEMLPIEEIVKGVKKKNPQTIVHCDCVQGYGKMLFSLNNIPLDLVSISAHKIHAPKGCGALYVREGVVLEPLFWGGSQESRLRPGTENVPGIVALGKAADKALIDIRTNWEYVTQLRDYLIEELSSINNIVINSPKQSIPYILNISILPYSTEKLLHEFRMKDIYISGSSACERGRRSHVIEAMGITGQRADSVIRIGLSKNNTFKELEKFIDVIKKIGE